MNLVAWKVVASSKNKNRASRPSLETAKWNLKQLLCCYCSWKTQMRNDTEEHHVSFDIKSVMANSLCPKPFRFLCDRGNLPGGFWDTSYLKNQEEDCRDCTFLLLLSLMFCFVFHWGIMIVILWAVWWMPSAILEQSTFGC